MQKAEYTVFKDHFGYWFVAKSAEQQAIACPDKFRWLATLTKSKIASCRLALEDARAEGASEIHLHGAGATTAIKKEAKAVGIKPFVYFASVATDLTQ